MSTDELLASETVAVVSIGAVVGGRVGVIKFLYSKLQFFVHVQRHPFELCQCKVEFRVYFDLVWFSVIVDLFLHADLFHKFVTSPSQFVPQRNVDLVLNSLCFIIIAGTGYTLQNIFKSTKKKKNAASRYTNLSNRT